MDANSFSIFLNPSKNELYLKLNDYKLNNVDTFIRNQNIVGNTVIELNNIALKDLLKLDITSLTQGVYILSVEIEGNVSHKKFIKKLRTSIQ